MYVDAEPVRIRARILRPIPALRGLEAELSSAHGERIGPLPMDPEGEWWGARSPISPTECIA